MPRIHQVLPPNASEYDKKCQRIDRELLQNVELTRDLTLIYGKPPVSELPEAVEEQWFGGGQAILPVRTDKIVCPPHRIGSFRRKSIVSLAEQTMARLHRTRDDIEWLLLDEPPQDFSAFDAWIDPAVDVDDRDGFVAEAQVAGKIVVATRTPINAKRLDQGRSGLLVPLGDANELAHAILTALFKPEVFEPKIEAAKQTISKYHPHQRFAALMLLLNA